MVIATVIDGAPAQVYAYGLADVGRRKPTTADTVFSVASISKAVTAWGVLRLAERDGIDLDAPARRYLSAWPLPPSSYPDSAVTIRRLLDHTAGINAGPDTFRRPGAPALSAIALLRGEGARAGAGRPKLIGPHGAYIYSAPGYTLLQMIVEQQSRQSFETYMRDVVFRPLGMNASTFAWDGRLGETTATPYSGGRPTAMVVPQDLAADGLFSTGADLARFVGAWLPDKQGPAGAGVLSAGAMRPLYKPPEGLSQVQPWGVGDGPAAGCFIEYLSDGRIVVTNGGYDPGWSSQFYIVPSTGDGIVILTNSGHAEPAIAQVAALWSVWRGLPPMKLTRAYRGLGTGVALTIGFLMMISISFAGHLVEDLATGVRRFGEFRPSGLVATTIECVLALGAMGLWVSARSTLQALPTFNAVGVMTITFFSLVALARFVCPIGGSRPHGFSQGRADRLARRHGHPDRAAVSTGAPEAALP
ncbi:MAG TPA: serine hydrolase domain-containing protein [Caulobacteraceae bacterium]